MHQKPGISEPARFLVSTMRRRAELKTLGICIRIVPLALARYDVFREIVDLTAECCTSMNEVVQY